MANNILMQMYAWFHRCSAMLFFCFATESLAAQKPTSISFGYGRAFFYYDFEDFGKGFVNEQSAHYNYVVEANVHIPVRDRIFIKSGLSFTMYQQYFSTPLQGGAYEAPYPIVKVPLLAGYVFSRADWELAMSGGVTVGFMPDQYIGEFEVYRYKLGVIDSIATGVVYREYRKLIPLISFDGEIRYKVSPKLWVYLKGSLDNGFSTITKFDVRYNAGSGANDQHAVQWGKGNSSSLSAGVRIKLSKTSTGQE